MEWMEAAEHDEPFLYELYKSTRSEEMASWGWDPSQQEAFLRMQYQLQRRSLDSTYTKPVHRIIVLDSQPAGRVFWSETESEIRLADISLLSEYRNQGIGSRIIGILQQEAAASGKKIVLQVLETNPAKNLYQRMGFQYTSQEGVYHTMMWKA